MKKKSLVRRIARRVKRFFCPPLSTEEVKKRKQLQDYEFLMEHGVDTQPGFVTLYGNPIIHLAPGARIIMEEGVTLISDSESNWAGINHPVIIAADEGAEIILHKRVGLSGTSIVAVDRVEIGEDTMLGANTNVYDTDFHSVEPKERLNQKTIRDASHAPITIGKNCWIGSNSTVLKGVRMGDNAVVGAMSLVNKDVPDNVLVGGVPAKIIKKL